MADRDLACFRRSPSSPPPTLRVLIPMMSPLASNSGKVKKPVAFSFDIHPTWSASRFFAGTPNSFASRSRCLSVICALHRLTSPPQSFDAPWAVFKSPSRLAVAFFRAPLRFGLVFELVGCLEAVRGSSLRFESFGSGNRSDISMPIASTISSNSHPEWQ